jgi:hypothetical protein
VKNLYQPYSVPAMADPAPLEKRLRHILFGRGGYTMRHAIIPLILGGLAMGALLPLRPKTVPVAVELAIADEVAVAAAPSDAREITAQISAQMAAQDAARAAVAPMQTELPPAAPPAEATQSVRPGRILDDFVTIHAARTPSSKVLWTAIKGQTLAVLSELDGLYGVLMVNNTIGWVKKSSIELQDETTQVPLGQALAPQRAQVQALEDRAAELEAELARTRQALEASREEDQRQRTFRIPYRTPSDGIKHQLRIVVTDRNGVRTAYEGTHEPATTSTQEVTGVGRPITLQLYDNGALKASSRPVK